eukprot:m.234239 g.234239  ORF g.234239 m.234239 type:complete len:949 (-) comp26517_c0_seq1:30-2876(-)
MALLYALLGSILFVSAFGTSFKPNHTTEYLLELTRSARPHDVDPTFDCGWRSIAIPFAKRIQPWIGTDAAKISELHDALQLTTLCNQSLADTLEQHLTHDAPDASHLHATNTSINVYVSTSGSDTHSGSLDSPVASLPRALAIVRNQRSANPTEAATIFFRSGTYYFNATVVLEPRDSFLTLTSYKGENVTLSGGAHIKGLSWTKAGTTPTGNAVFETTLPNGSTPNGVKALHVNGARATLARYPNANPELDLFPVGYIREKTTWLPPIYPPYSSSGQVCDPKDQCGKSVNLTVAVTDAWHGMYQNWTVGVGGACEVYDPPQSPWCSGQFYLERQFPEMHTRHPSGVDTTNLRKSYADVAGAVVHAWRPGHWYTWMFEVGSQTHGKNVSHWTVVPNSNNVYGMADSKKDNDQVKYLGTYKSDQDCWKACNNSMSTKGIPCNAWTWHQLNFGDPDWNGGCYFTVGGVWGPTPENNVMSGHGPHVEGGTFSFSAGGNQGGEGSETAAEWFVEGLKEELDASNEFYFDESSRTLSLIYNSTDSSSPPSEVVVPTLAQLFVVQGAQEFPVKNITFTGLTFTANRPTFLDPRGNPSGGDWALERMGAIFFEGTEHCLVQANLFIRLDSNAVFLSGYNRFTTIDRNEFVWLGQSAIALWGKADNNDGTNGDQPRLTTVSGNWVHEIGNIQKQSSFLFQAVSAQTTIRGNVAFNMPRAAVNVNDGFGGGLDMSENILFNTCRESSDHGTFNSWDRLPYFTDVRDGTTRSSVPAVNNVHNNFLVSNYAADGGCLDNDDGSSYYEIHHNFCVYGGHKSDFDGNNKISHHNLQVYPNVYGITCINVGAQNLPPAGYAEGYHDNICILPKAGDNYMTIGGVDSSSPCLSPGAKTAFEQGLLLGNNSVYVPSGNAAVHCGGQHESITDFHNAGYDTSTIVSSQLPNSSTIIAWAKPLLGL